MSDLTGSSPLTRGKRRDEAYLIHGMRLIPAHAGKTSPKHWAQQPAAAHPRSRGENSEPPMRAPSRAGSSPLTQGKQHARVLPHPRGKLIPAHAGKTCAWRKRERTCWAHPRSRGENGNALTAAINPTGSSPLTRGKLLACVTGVLWRGLIPAHAGKTAIFVFSLSVVGAHPRSRGENYRPCE